MIRFIVLLAIAFALPFVLHGLVTLALGRGFRLVPTRLRGRLWLGVAGLVLAIALLVDLIGRSPRVLGERYVPAHMEGTTLVPGRFENK